MSIAKKLLDLILIQNKSYLMEMGAKYHAVQGNIFCE